MNQDHIDKFVESFGHIAPEAIPKIAEGMRRMFSAYAKMKAGLPWRAELAGLPIRTRPNRAARRHKLRAMSGRRTIRP